MRRNPCLGVICDGAMVVMSDAMTSVMMSPPDLAFLYSPTFRTQHIMSTEYSVVSSGHSSECHRLADPDAPWLWWTPWGMS